MMLARSRADPIQRMYENQVSGPTCLILDQSSQRAEEIASVIWPSDTTDTFVWSNDVSTIESKSPQLVLAHDGAMVMSKVCASTSKRSEWTPVIAYGVRSSPMRVVDALRLGVIDFIEWPARTDETRSRVQESVEMARADAFGRQRSYHARRQLEELSVREREVLGLLSEGGSNKAMARTLNLSPRTVEIHRANMMRKLNCPTSAAAIRLSLVANLN